MAIFGDRDLIGITIVDDRDLSDFFSKIFLSISITLNNSYSVDAHAMTSQNELNKHAFFSFCYFVQRSHYAVERGGRQKCTVIAGLRHKHCSSPSA